MPLDRFLFRASRKETFNPEIVKQSQTRRFKDPALVDKLVALDEKIYALQNKLDDNAKNKNILQKAITERLKNEKQPPTDEQKESIKQFKENEEALTKELEQAKEEFDRELPKLGNIVHDSVPVSNDEVNNGIVSEWGDKKIDESIESHAQALWRIGGYDPDAGAKVAGHRGYYLTGPAVLLNQALINYSLGFLIKKGYVPVQPPYFMNKKVMAGVAQLEEFNESLYHVGALSRGANETAASASASTAAEDKKGGAKKAAAAAADEEDDKYLIATSEQPLCALHIGSAFAKEELPRMYAGISTCFRKEAGKHGKDTWGIFRVHQFDKVEQFVICAPEDSWRIHEEMRQTSEEFLQSLGLPYRVVNIVSGELNNAAAKKYDIEGWFPNYKEYKELMSLSNCTDYQSRAMEIKFGLNPVEIDGVRVQRYVHMLNATLCALTRTICCILENYQETRVDENGNEQQGVRVPQVLLQYMNGLEFIPFVREGKDIPTEDGKKSKGAEKPKATASTASAASTGAKKGTYTIGKDSYKTSVKKLIGKKFATIEEFSKFLAQ